MKFLGPSFLTQTHDDQDFASAGDADNLPVASFDCKDQAIPAGSYINIASIILNCSQDCIIEGNCMVVIWSDKALTAYLLIDNNVVDSINIPITSGHIKAYSLQGNIKVSSGARQLIVRIATAGLLASTYSCTRVFGACIKT